MKKFALLLVIVAVICTSVLSVASCKKEGDGESEAKRVYHTVTFDSVGGNTVATQRVEDGKPIKEPEAPEKTGYSFRCWVFRGVTWDFSTPITADIYLTATWYDKSIKHRVTVGVQSSIADRGTAEIVGKQTSSVNFSEGDEVTLKATANDGFEFKGWVDFSTGVIVSNEPTYKFVAEKEITLEASFKYVITGLDNAQNKALWDALNKTMEENSFRIKMTAQTEGEAGATESVYSVSVNKAQGLAVIKEEVSATAREIWIEYNNGASKYYLYADGALTEIKLPEFSEVGMEGIPAERVDFGSLLFGDADEAEMEQLLLAVYSLFKGNLTTAEDGLNFAIPVGNILEGARDFYLENKSVAIKKLLYGYVKPAFDKILADNDAVIFEGITTSDLFNSMSIEAFVAMMGMMVTETPSVEAGEQFLADFNENAKAIIKQICSYLADAGLNYSEDALLAEYNAFMKGNLTTALESFNTDAVGGGKDDVPSGTDLIATLIYAGLNNFTVGDTIELVLRDIGLLGGEWDITDEALDFSDVTANGVINIENGKITYASFAEESTSGSLSIEFFVGIGDLQLPKTA